MNFTIVTNSENYQAQNKIFIKEIYYISINYQISVFLNAGIQS
jgi:hypothetical protein